MAQRAVKAGTNFVEPEKIRGFVSEIEAANDRLTALRMDYMTKCKGPHGDIKAVLDEAKKAGVPKASLRAVVKSRELERKAKKQREDLGDLDHQDKYDLIRHALGDLADTPLGQAATANVKPAGSLHAV